MASSQPPRVQTTASLPAPRYRGQINTPDTTDDIIGLCLYLFLPLLFFCGIIVLITMLTAYTLVMRRALPRLFAFIIVITFAVLITITFFLLVIFHVRRCQRKSSTISEAFTGEINYDFPSSFRSSELLLTAAQGSSAGHPSDPLKKTKRQDNIRQAIQAQDFKTGPVSLEATDSFHGSTPALPSSHSSKKAKTYKEIERLRPTKPQRPPPLVVPSSACFNGPPTPSVPFVPEIQKETPIYYLPPGPLSPLPSAGFRPMWADDFERQIEANQLSCAMDKRRKFWSKTMQLEVGTD